MMRALRLLQLVEENDAPTWTVTFTHEGAPASKARARVVKTRSGRSVAFTPGETKAAQDMIALLWRQATRGQTRDGAIAISCIFYRPNRQRIDGDNMLKLVLDAGTQAHVWFDDSQVATMLVRVELDRERPRTEVALMPTTSTLDRDMFKTLTCPGCQKDYTRAVSATVTSTAHAQYVSAAGFCSPACAKAATLRPAICIQCTKEFMRRSYGQRVCSADCRSENAKRSYSAAVSAGKRKGPPLCEKCGARVSRREYKQCAKCLGRGRPKETAL